MNLMRAAIHVAPRRVIVDRVPVPEPASNQALIKVEGCGICASSLPLWQGKPWFQYPTEPGATGHEAWGRIAALGSDVQHLTVADRVAALSSHAYAEYDVANADAVLPIPESLNGKPFPGEPLGCAMNILRRCDLHLGMTIAIVGIGFLGALMTRLACLAGARVIAISRRPYALERASEMGASATIPMTSTAFVAERVHSLTHGQGCPRVIEAVGNQLALDIATELVGERGKLVIAGYHQDGLRQIDMQQWNWKGIDVVNAHERDPRAYLAGMQSALDAVIRGSIDLTPLLTHTFGLAQLSEAFTMLETRPEGFLKAVVVP